MLDLCFPIKDNSRMDKKTYVRAELKRRTGQLEKVAEITGVSRRTIGNVLNDRDIRLSTLDALCKYLKDNRRKKTL